MKPIVLAAAILAQVTVVSAQESMPAKTIPICDLLRDPGKYNGDVIAVRGVYWPGGHGLYLKGEGCDGTLVTKGYRWPSLIWIVNEEQEMRRHGRSPDSYLQALAEIAEARRRELLRKGPSAKSEKVVVTYIGLFETRSDLASSVIRRSDGTTVGAGFGQVPGAPGQLFVDSVRDISVEIEPIPPAK